MPLSAVVSDKPPPPSIPPPVCSALHESSTQAQTQARAGSVAGRLENLQTLWICTVYFLTTAPNNNNNNNNNNPRHRLVLKLEHKNYTSISAATYNYIDYINWRYNKNETITVNIQVALKLGWCCN